MRSQHCDSRRRSRRERPASPAPKANDDLVRATFYTDCAKVKNGAALGVRVNAIVRLTDYFCLFFIELSFLVG